MDPLTPRAELYRALVTGGTFLKNGKLTHAELAEAAIDAYEAEVRAKVAREVYALKTPPPDGSAHYRSGWDDALDTAVDTIRKPLS